MLCPKSHGFDPCRFSYSDVVTTRLMSRFSQSIFTLSLYKLLLYTTFWRRRNTKQVLCCNSYRSWAICMLRFVLRSYTLSYISVQFRYGLRFASAEDLCVFLSYTPFIFQEFKPDESGLGWLYNCSGFCNAPPTYIVCFKHNIFYPIFGQFTNTNILSTQAC